MFIFLNRQSYFYTPVDEVSGVELFSYNYPETFQIITPPSHNCGNSHIPGFGATITKLGDINHDGFQGNVNDQKMYQCHTKFWF